MTTLIQLAQSATLAATDPQIITSISQIQNELIFIPIALLIIAYLIYTRKLSKSAFVNAPKHLKYFDLFDLLIVIGLYLIGTIFYSQVLAEVAKFNIIPGLTLTNDQLSFATDQLEAAMQIVAQFFIYAPPITFLFVKSFKEPHGLTAFGFTSKHPFKDLLSGTLSFLACLPTIMGMVAIVMLISLSLGDTIPTLGHEILQIIATTDSNLVILFYAISAILIAPVAEEVIYRGALQTALTNFINRPKPDGSTRSEQTQSINRWLVVIFASILFMSIHIPVVPSWHPLVGHFTLGLFLAWLYEKHSSLIPCITLHLLFNATNFGYVFLMAQNN